MIRARKFSLFVMLATTLLALPTSSRAQNAPVVIRVGHFPNITHAQGVIGQATGWFDKALAPEAKVEWKIFNAGPSVIEALFAGALDLAYIGPNPAINGYVRSQGEALRIVAGATSGGAAMVVRADSGIQKPEDFRGRKIASPQLGNTQDVALRGWLNAHKLKLREKGGDVQVIPIANPDQLTLFLKKEIDAAWAPEPWASRLIHEANGRLLFDERDLWPGGQFVTTHLIVSTKFLKAHRALVKKWVRAHVELTEWIHNNLPAAKQVLNREIQKETGKPLPLAVLNDSISRLQVTYDPIRSSLFTSARWAFEAGFLGRQRPDLSGIYDLSILNEVLNEKGAKPIR
ncbi:MAG: sulfate ABC transporter substrate-binding protein [Acidobacteria bacterium RIFCSPLOWO2_02_FULL_59_13]|nr:MAG: sulfate ABC transporter substrate-binding protein [Acidobacteria bacterium RIFCSPLOWO2_02_FULL_59_13]